MRARLAQGAARFCGLGGRVRFGYREGPLREPQPRCSRWRARDRPCGAGRLVETCGLEPVGHPSLSGKLDDVTALGVIALNYGELEAAFRTLSAVISGMDADHVVKFYETKNQSRTKAVEQAITESDLPDKLKDYGRYFVQCYKQCAANRNDMMHSSIGEFYVDAARGSSGFIFSKYRSGDQLFCTARLEELRRIADQLHAITAFGNNVAFFVSQFWLDRKNHMIDPERHLSLLKQRPDFPTALDWQKLPRLGLRK